MTITPRRPRRPAWASSHSIRLGTIFAAVLQTLNAAGIDVASATSVMAGVLPLRVQAIDPDSIWS